MFFDFLIKGKAMKKVTLTPSQRKYIDADFPSTINITEAVRAKNASYRFTGGVRINNSMYRTDKETREYFKKSLKKKLP